MPRLDMCVIAREEGGGGAIWAYCQKGEDKYPVPTPPAVIQGSLPIDEAIARTRYPSCHRTFPVAISRRRGSRTQQQT